MAEKIFKNIDVIISDDFIDYEDSLLKFDKYLSDKKQLIWCLEHENVYTCGSSLLNNHGNKINGIPVVQSNRGGLITFHGHGQIVVYFCINILNFFKRIGGKVDINYIISSIEDIGIKSLKHIGIDAFTMHDIGRGIWSNGIDSRPSKIGFIGIRISKGYLTHGISINFDNDLSFFNFINSCGLDCLVTSVKDILQGLKPDKLEFKKIITDNFFNFFNEGY